MLENKEWMMERLELVMERLDGILEEKASGVLEPYRDYFCHLANYCKDEYEILITGNACKNESAQEKLFGDVEKENYEKSYANPTYACEKCGKEYGQLLSALFARMIMTSWRVFEGDERYLCLYAELVVEVFNGFEDVESMSPKELEEIVYSFMHDNLDLFAAESIERLILPKYDYCRKLVMESDLSDAAYLYQYGLYIGEDEKKASAFLQTLSDEDVQSMADTFTEGYRIGFITTGKDIRKKSVAEIRYPIGFERMVKLAVQNFSKLGLESILSPYSISENKQFVYDHKEDRALWFNKSYAERNLEVLRLTWDKYKAEAPKYGGPAVIEVFGTEPFVPKSKKEAVRYDSKQQQLVVYEKGESSRLCNEAIRGEERSFTIIAYPVASIGEQFEEIFTETVKINTLDYALYRDMQQKIIDVLDTADCVHIVGTNGNKTDLYVKIAELANPDKETAFENCVADVNIPVGEVFTTPVLKGTNGKLFVSQVYLNELSYNNLELDFTDGQISAYTCTNFDCEEENKKYIEENVLFHHKTLPMGEFAIGTNTMAYRMGRVYQIADKLPILIAEKTGPHFAVGDTCYTYEEDMMTYNPDGKAIVARDNEISILRKEDFSKAYFNCHTDITIPYDELGLIEVIRKDGSKEAIIENGRFVVPGTEVLNVPLDEM